MKRSQVVPCRTLSRKLLHDTRAEGEPLRWGRNVAFKGYEQICKADGCLCLAAYHDTPNGAEMHGKSISKDFDRFSGQRTIQACQMRMLALWLRAIVKRRRWRGCFIQMAG